jgi:hypothetical protein
MSSAKKRSAPSDQGSVSLSLAVRQMDGTSLRPESFKADAEALKLATVIAEETEAARAASMKTAFRAEPVRRGLLEAKPLPRAELQRWYEFATDLHLLQRAAERLELDGPTLVSQVMSTLHPPNWETFFYIRAWWELALESESEEAILDATAKKRARQMVSTSARKAAEVRHAENHSMHDGAIAWYKMHRGEFSTKDKAAQHITTLMPVAFSTARRWLRRL